MFHPTHPHSAADSASGSASFDSLVSLHSVSASLESDLVSLNSQLVDLLNRECADFIGLSSSLLGSDQLIASLVEQFSVISWRLHHSRSLIASARNQFSVRLADRRLVESKQFYCELAMLAAQRMELLAELMGKVKNLEDPKEKTEESPESFVASLFPAAAAVYWSSLTDIGCGAANSFFSDFLQNSHFLCLAARVISQLRAFSSVLIAFRSLFDSSFASFDSQIIQFRSLLESHFLRILEISSTKNSSAADQTNFIEKILVNLLRTFKFFGIADFPESILRNNFLHARLSLSSDSLKSLSAPRLFDFLDKIISSDLSSLLRIESEQIEFSGFFHFRSVAFSEFGRFLADLPSNFFNSSNPDEIRANFTLSKRFLISHGLFHSHWQAAQAIQLKPASSNSSLTHSLIPSIEAFLKRWNFQLYYQLQFQSIAAPFDSMLAPAVSVSASHSDLLAHSDYLFSNRRALENQVGFYLISSFECWRAMEKCWRPEIYMVELHKKFTKLTMQLLVRWENWVRTNIKTPPVKPNNEKLQSAEKPANRNESASAAANAVPAAPMALLAFIHHDLNRMTLLVVDRLIPDLVPRFSSSNLPSQLFRPSLARLAALQPAVEELLFEELLNSAAPLLDDGVTRIKSQYSLTNRPIPVLPSVYVSKSLERIVGFQSRLDLLGNSRAELFRRLYAALAMRFVDRARELLRLLSEMELMLNKLKKKSTAVESVSGEADGDKARTQLSLDVKEFARLFEVEWQVKPDNIEVVQTLKSIANAGINKSN